MPKDEWGVKRLCPHCASRFYDLQRDPMTCPECGHTFTAESLVAGRGRTLISEKAAPKATDLDTDDLTDDTDLDDDAADSDIDDDLLEDDDDDDVSLDDIADVAGNDDDS
ncbi:TIGR02300 family protein [Defluviimonas aestuarii]|jgi:predicted  nucleic acid-binding Zn-ribbon protein|uniref:TIGR02300 family protein n=1 Tax=Albidovulum aestuarii TaxID=1130726 RepID=UPI00249A049B|nr:TIGR02300 family protein [Defluviimonas aestuarii]MDI3336659.1 TIGR02300 family protein [Defluviimonas aestuarii]